MKGLHFKPKSNGAWQSIFNFLSSSLLQQKILNKSLNSGLMLICKKDFFLYIRYDAVILLVESKENIRYKLN